MACKNTNFTNSEPDLMVTRKTFNSLFNMLQNFYLMSHEMPFTSWCYLPVSCVSSAYIHLFESQSVTSHNGSDLRYVTINKMVPICCQALNSLIYVVTNKDRPESTSLFFGHLSKLYKPSILWWSSGKCSASAFGVLLNLNCWRGLY